jgi:hypothetical protein
MLDLSSDRERRRWLPVRPDLEQLRRQANDLLRAIHAGDSEALADLERFHLEKVPPQNAKLADAQLVVACELTDAIWRDDVDAVRAMIGAHPRLRHENTLMRADSDWGPPLTYAANLGRDRIVTMLHGLGATDLESALGRAVLQSRVGTAALLHQILEKPVPPDGAFSGPAYTLSVAGIAFLFEIGARVFDAAGKSIAAVDVVLETDSRNPRAKHAILEMYAEHGVSLPDTPTMALHRGRIDLLEERAAIRMCCGGSFRTRRPIRGRWVPTTRSS